MFINKHSDSILNYKIPISPTKRKLLEHIDNYTVCGIIKPAPASAELRLIAWIPPECSGATGGLNMYNTHLITHYTSDSAFESIISHGKLRFTDINYLNDFRERNLFIDELKKCVDLSEYKEILPAEFLELLEQRMVSELDSTVSKQRCFILSFSSSIDDLAMWNYYSKNSPHGGYNLSFDPDLLFETISQNEIFNCAYAKLLFGSVFYDANVCDKVLEHCSSSVKGVFEKEAVLYSILNEPFAEASGDTTVNKIDIETLSLRLPQFLQEIKKYSPELSALGMKLSVLPYTCNSKDAPHVVKSYCNKNIYNDSFSLDSFYKNTSFAFEKESRVVVQIAEEYIPELIAKGIYKNRVAHGMIIPYLELSFDKSAIKQVYVAPMNFVDGNIDNTKRFLREHDVDAIVKKSDITVRF